jgi:hypothetical protein
MITTTHHLDENFARDRGYAAVVAKPFEIRQFLHMIEQCVAAGRPTPAAPGT